MGEVRMDLGEMIKMKAAFDKKVTRRFSAGVLFFPTSSDEIERLHFPSGGFTPPTTSSFENTPFSNNAVETVNWKSPEIDEHLTKRKTSNFHQDANTDDVITNRSKITFCRPVRKIKRSDRSVFRTRRFPLVFPAFPRPIDGFLVCFPLIRMCGLGPTPPYVRKMKRGEHFSEAKRTLGILEFR